MDESERIVVTPLYDQEKKHIMESYNTCLELQGEARNYPTTINRKLLLEKTLYLVLKVRPHITKVALKKLQNEYEVTSAEYLDFYESYKTLNRIKHPNDMEINWIFDLLVTGGEIIERLGVTKISYENEDYDAPEYW
jgi:hypothetical protein